METLSQITVMVDNNTGSLAGVCKVLGENGININTIAALEHGINGAVKFIVDDAEKAESSLKNSGYDVTQDEVLIVNVIDRPGELAKLAALMASAYINIESIFILGHINNETRVAMKVDDIEKARKMVSGTIIFPEKKD